MPRRVKLRTKCIFIPNRFGWVCWDLRGRLEMKFAMQLTRDAVVAVSERGDLFTAEVVAEVVEAAEEVVEQPHLYN